MNKQQTPHALTALQVALEKYSRSILPFKAQTLRESVIVRMPNPVGFRFQGGIRWLFELHTPQDVTIDWNTIYLQKEIERIMPNVHVVSVDVYFHSRTMMFQVKELGRRGTYWLEIHQVKA